MAGVRGIAGVTGFIGAGMTGATGGVDMGLGVIGPGGVVETG